MYLQHSGLSLSCQKFLGCMKGLGVSALGLRCIIASASLLISVLGTRGSLLYLLSHLAATAASY